ncbi:hypothetical protein DRO59_08360 [Candidatus Bathyarchaeota archaeon]|nr:MAG: hypothetical protein DRO59_08360 [Candidatus Bathyarchaeota archaeon]
MKDCSQCPYWQYVRSWIGTPYKRGWRVRKKGTDCVAFVLKCAEVCFKRNDFLLTYKSSNLRRLRNSPFKFLQSLADDWGGELKLPPYEPRCGDMCLRELGTKFDVWSAFKIGGYYAYASLTGVTLVRKFQADIMITFGGLKCPS